MPKNESTITPAQALIDQVKGLSAAELAKLLTEARKAEKAKEDELAALPSFAFALVIADSAGHFDSVSFWSGKAQDEATAQAQAKADVQGKLANGAIVYSIAARPLPLPRGRKASSAPDAT